MLPYLRLLLAVLGVLGGFTARAQTVLGRTVYDKFIPGYWSQNTNANSAVLGLKNATAPLVLVSNHVFFSNFSVTNSSGSWLFQLGSTNTVARLQDVTNAVLAVAGDVDAAQFIWDGTLHIKSGAVLTAPVLASATLNNADLPSGKVFSLSGSTIAAIGTARITRDDGGEGDFAWDAITTNTFVLFRHFGVSTQAMWAAIEAAGGGGGGEVTLSMLQSATNGFLRNSGGKATNTTAYGNFLLNFATVYVDNTYGIEHSDSELDGDWRWDSPTTNTLARMYEVWWVGAQATNALAALFDYVDGQDIDLYNFILDLQGGTNGLHASVLNLRGATNGLHTSVANLNGSTNGLDASVLNLRGATNGLDAAVVAEAARAAAAEAGLTNLAGKSNFVTSAHGTLTVSNAITLGPSGVAGSALFYNAGGVETLALTGSNGQARAQQLLIATNGVGFVFTNNPGNVILNIRSVSAAPGVGVSIGEDGSMSINKAVPDDTLDVVGTAHITGSALFDSEVATRANYLYSPTNIATGTNATGNTNILVTATGPGIITYTLQNNFTLTNWTGFAGTAGAKTLIFQGHPTTYTNFIPVGRGWGMNFRPSRSGNLTNYSLFTNGYTHYVDILWDNTNAIVSTYVVTE